MQARTAEAIERTTVHFSGRVQGVGFRYVCHNIAQQYDVHGYVRNLSDGRVELVLEGPHGQTDELLGAVRQRMEGFIKAVDLHVQPATGEFSQFAIRG